MNETERMEWLRRFSETCGVSGFEGRMKQLMQERLAVYKDVSYDKLGSVIFTKKAENADAPKIMLASHMDEIGFLVKYITKDGFLRFTCLGGWWEQVMLSQRVIVHGSKGDLVGVIGSKPPHILPAEERNKVVQKKDMYIDIGANSAEEVRELGVFEGCAVTPDVKMAAMGDGKTLEVRLGITVSAVLSWLMLWIMFWQMAVRILFMVWLLYKKR